MCDKPKTVVERQFSKQYPLQQGGPPIYFTNSNFLHFLKTKWNFQGTFDAGVTFSSDAAGGVHWHLFVRNPSGTLTRLTSKTVLASEDHGGKKERGKKNIVWCSEINHHSLVRHLRGIQSTSKTSRLEHSFFPKCFWEGSPHIPAYG